MSRLLKIQLMNMCKFCNAIINRQILNSANIHLQSFGGHFTKYSSHQIFWLYYFLLILYRLAKYQHTRALQEIQWCYMCATVPPVQFLLITISCYMLEKEILGVLMCIMSRASAHAILHVIVHSGLGIGYIHVHVLRHEQSTKNRAVAIRFEAVRFVVGVYS